jgi:hypothetical protein
MSIHSFDEFGAGETLPPFESDFQFLSSLENGSRAAFPVREFREFPQTQRSGNQQDVYCNGLRDHTGLHGRTRW